MALSESAVSDLLDALRVGEGTDLVRELVTLRPPPPDVVWARDLARLSPASNLAAIRALATDGIQRGHMSLHARSVAAA